MKIEKKPITDEEGFNQFIRISRGNIMVKIVLISGKEGNHYVTLAPSINVSGYGSTRKAADESFDENMDTFLDDLIKLSKKERENEIFKLGFKQERFKNKNFSKAYVDENGVLKNFEAGTLRKKVIETSLT